MNNKKNYDDWNIHKKQINNYKITKIKKKIREGDIYWVVVGVNIGQEIHHNKPPFNRPVLILKDVEKGFLGIPLTSKEQKDLTYFFKFEDNKSKTQYASLAQIRFFDYRRVQQKKSEISLEDFHKLKEKLIRNILN